MKKGTLLIFALASIVSARADVKLVARSNCTNAVVWEVWSNMKCVAPVVSLPPTGLDFKVTVWTADENGWTLKWSSVPTTGDLAETFKTDSKAELFRVRYRDAKTGGISQFATK